MNDCRSLWTLKYFDRFGGYLFDLPYENFTLNRKKNDEGILTVQLPLGDLDFGLFECDYRIEVHKTNANTGVQSLWDNTCWFLRKIDLTVESSGGNCLETLELQLFDATSLLRRRIVSWLSKDSPMYPSIILEDTSALLSAIFFYNFKEGVTDPALLNTFFSPAYTPASPFDSSPAIDFWQLQVYSGNMNLRQMPIRMEVPQRCENGTSIEVNVSFENVLVAMQTIAEGSELNGQLVHFDIVYTPATQANPADFLFKVWCGIRGNDRCNTGVTNRIILGPEYGNMANVTITKDYSDTANIVYVGGSGDNELREINSDFTTGCPSPFGNIEAFISANNTESVFSLLTEAQTELVNRQPVIEVTGEYIAVPPTLFGVDFGPWDRVCFEYKDIQGAIDINEYTINVDSQGEQIDIPLTMRAIF